ncbi:GLPGLI family protein [Taibaiella soli]|uniref:GLPGLI family protein n=1 Tax=Taibaiella soli TaxID=1649169 RepID=A0A2W2B1Z9_9BACT|nr:GLPGLI family protein [Taibaiella soli]PZF74048.1 hypothetical protein DN068_04975 [Taibaiella soli]
MKKIFSAFALALSMPALAQQTTGIITYRQTVSLNLESQDIPESLKAMLPKEQQSEKILYFSPTASLYEASAQKADKNMSYTQGNTNVMMQTNGGEAEHIVYTDLKAKKIVEQEDLMGRVFLIDKDIPVLKWKFTGRQKTIIGLPCMEAVALDKKDSVMVWFTTSIPVNAGPQVYAGLPGMILEMTMNQVHFVALSVTTADDKTLAKIKAPVKGKKVTEEEFEKITEQKIDELRKQYGGGGSGNTVIFSPAGN